MRTKNFLILLGVVLTTLTATFTNVNAQNPDDLVYSGSGDWNTAGNWMLADGAGGYKGNAYAVPTGGDNVWILAGSNVTCSTSLPVCMGLNVAGTLTTTAASQLSTKSKVTISGTMTLGTTFNCYSNLEIKGGGKLTSVQAGVYQTVFVGGGGAYNNAITITNNGQLTNVNIHMIPDASKLTLTGANGTTTLNQLGMSANSNYRDQTIVVDCNLFILNSISMSRWGSNYKRTLTVNAGKTVTLGTGAFLHLNPETGSPSASESGTEDFYYNINGTLNALNGGINLCTSASTQTVNLDQIFEFNVGPQGTVIVGDVVRKHVGKTSTRLSVNVAPGGQIIYEGAYYTTNECAIGIASGGLSSVEVTNSLLTSANNQNLKFSYGTTLSGDSTVIVKGNYVQGGDLNGKPLTLSGSSLQTINTGGTSIAGLTINKVDNRVLLSTPLTIAGALTLTSGNLNLADNDLTIAAGGSVSGGSSASHIITDGAGVLRQTVTSAGANFPLGLSADSYDPVRIKPASTNVFAAKVYTTRTGTPNEGVTYNRPEWDIASTATAATELTFTPFEADYKTPYAVIGHYTGGAWTDAMATLNGDSYTGTFSSFSPFATGSSLTPAALERVTKSFDWRVSNRQLTVNGLNANDIVSIYNVSGQQVATTIAADGRASVSLDNAGVYIAKVKSNNATNTFKLVAE